MPDDLKPGETWIEYRRLVLSELKRHEERIAKLEEQQISILIKVAGLGATISCLTSLIFWLLSR